jgi:hypothetical protein
LASAVQFIVGLGKVSTISPATRTSGRSILVGMTINSPAHDSLAFVSFLPLQTRNGGYLNSDHCNATSLAQAVKLRPKASRNLFGCY